MKRVKLQQVKAMAKEILACDYVEDSNYVMSLGNSNEKKSVPQGNSMICSLLSRVVEGSDENDFLMIDDQTWLYFENLYYSRVIKRVL